MTEDAASPLPVEQAIRAALASLAEAVAAVLGTDSVDRFGRAARVCGMGQRLSSEIVTNVKQANAIRNFGAVDGAFGGDYLNGDYAMYNPQMPLPMVPVAPVNDQVQLMRDLMMMLQSTLGDQKKAVHRPRRDRLDLYAELNEAITARTALFEQAGHGHDAHVAVLDKQIARLVAAIEQEKEGDPDNAATIVPDLVPTELLRGHPPGAPEQWGDEARHRGAVLHREDCGPGPDQGGAADGGDEACVG